MNKNRLTFRRQVSMFPNPNPSNGLKHLTLIENQVKPLKLQSLRFYEVDVWVTINTPKFHI